MFCLILYSQESSQTSGAERQYLFKLDIKDECFLLPFDFDLYVVS